MIVTSLIRHTFSSCTRTQNQTVDTVVTDVGLRFVKGDKEGDVFVVGVREFRFQEGSQPSRGGGDVGVVGVVVHVGFEIDVVCQVSGGGVNVQLGRVDDFGAPGRVVLDVGKRNEGVVLADVETVVVGGTEEALARGKVRGVVFLVVFPGDVFGFEEIDEVGLREKKNP
jgi:hypothetical protein